MVWLDPEKTRAWRKDYNPKYYKENREILRQKQKEYYEKTKHIHAERKKRNYDPIKRKERTIREKERSSILSKLWRERNKERRKIYEQEFEKRPERIAYRKQWRKENPRSKCSSYPLELEIAMNNVRIRDKNTCQWFNCNLTHREAPIDVHHIFPRSEYPELELIEKYMLCYCLNHHVMFHQFRGDKVWQLLASRRFEKPLEETSD